MPMRDDLDGTLWAESLDPEFEKSYRDGMRSIRDGYLPSPFGPPQPSGLPLNLTDRMESRLDSHSSDPPRSALLDLLAENPEARAIREGMRRRK